jgi:hypothetical protein
VPITLINSNGSGGFSLLNNSNSGKTVLRSGPPSDVITDGLVLSLDAGNPVSYPGTGDVWYDLSGNGRNFTMYNSLTWNSGGYFSFDGVDDYMLGPSGNTFELNQTHTIEAIIQPTVAKASTLFAFPNSATQARAISGHVPWSDNVVYYDVGGCCGVTQRISYGSTIVNRTVYMTFRCRNEAQPFRQIFENNVSRVSSGANSTNTISFTSEPVILGNFYPTSNNTWYQGRMYALRVYNRGLSDAELTQNFNSVRSKYGL